MPLAVQKLVVLPATVVVQQGWPAPPQVPQLPFVQVPVRFGQVEPADEQTLLTQQPTLPATTLPQPLPTQQGWPGLPHGLQMPWPLPVQTSFPSQARPAQQAWPAPPQD
ncbi:MAG TPA: hypothetical protein PKL17_00760 [Pseudomonadota bacterium]|jgi:hypothetical protein|nr:hypothetical protein [Pseudomonadota bacterium]